MVKLRKIMSIVFLVFAVLILIIGDTATNPVDTVRFYSALILSTVWFAGIK